MTLPASPRLTRRAVLGAGAGLAASLAGASAYAAGVEPGWRLGLARYHLSPKSWPADLPLRIAVIADLHAGEPWISESRVHDVVDMANALKPDVTVLLGDFVCTHRFVTRHVRPEAWADALKRLDAPLGVWSILGNHDWWSAAMPTEPRDGGDSVRAALRRAGCPPLENDAVRLVHRGKPFWIAGLGDQMAIWLGRRGAFRGVDDLDKTLARTRADEPAILLAHEPWIFARTPPRPVALTLAGHTHGGQVNLPILGAPHMKRALDLRYRYGHIVEDGRHLVVSGGLGTSIAPLRLFCPPEVVEVALGPPPLGA
jgi:predicted MPP superfamily phosphohydrolase